MVGIAFFVCSSLFVSIHRHFSVIMSSTDAKLVQINAFLGDGIRDILKNPNCKLFFESNAEAKKGTKVRKSCIVYIVYDNLLICRPRKYSKKYYVKYRLLIDSLHMNSGDNSNSGDVHTSNSDPIVLTTHDQNEYTIWYNLLVFE